MTDENEDTYASIPAGDPHKMRWYHGRITRAESEKRLSQSGSINGLYLLRDHLFHDAYYVLSMNYEGAITHYVIVRNFHDGTVSFTGSDRKFTGPIELIGYYTRHPSCLPCQLQRPCVMRPGVSAATLEGLSPEELKQEMISIALMHKLSKDEIRKMLSSPKRPEFERLTRKFLHQKRDWFHGAILKKKAERRLEASGLREGSYLVWLKPRKHTYYLSLCYKGSVIHYPIKMETVLGQVSIAVSMSKCFDSLMLLIDYYQKQKEILANVLGVPCDVKDHTQKRVHDTRILITGPLPKVFKKILQIDDLDSIKFSNRGEIPRYIPIEDGMESVSRAATGNHDNDGVAGGADRSGRTSPASTINSSTMFSDHFSDDQTERDIRSDEDQMSSDTPVSSLKRSKKKHKKIGSNHSALYADVHRGPPPVSPRIATLHEPVNGNNQQQMTEMVHMANRFRSTEIPPLDPIRENSEEDATSVVSRVSSISSAVETIGPVISNPQGNYRLCLIRVPENSTENGRDTTPTSDYQSSDTSDNTIVDSDSHGLSRDTRVHFVE